MPVVVQKYGGSSVADVDKLSGWRPGWRRAARAGGVCVVVSAMGDTTDDLLQLAKQVSRDPPRRELDMLLTAGERISMALLSIALQERGVDAISFTGSQAGILTTDAHATARILEVRPTRVREELARGQVVIVAGFQGVSARKEITTLGRGGSDTTAVALAAALAADCEIYSDVAGVFTADPRVVPGAAAPGRALLRGDAGAGRGRRQGAQRPGGGVRPGHRHRHPGAQHLRRDGRRWCGRARRRARIAGVAVEKELALVDVPARRRAGAGPAGGGPRPVARAGGGLACRRPGFGRGGARRETGAQVTAEGMARSPWSAPAWRTPRVREALVAALAGWARRRWPSAPPVTVTPTRRARRHGA